MSLKGMTVIFGVFSPLPVWLTLWHDPVADVRGPTPSYIGALSVIADQSTNPRFLSLNEDDMCVAGSAKMLLCCNFLGNVAYPLCICLLYTSDAADE